MASEHSDHGAGTTMPTAFKILVAGGFGVGKTTLVGAVSEIRPLLTEEYLTDESIGIDDTSGVEMKSTTTVALDFGRITVNDDLVLYLFWHAWPGTIPVRLGRACVRGHRGGRPGGYPSA